MSSIVQNQRASYLNQAQTAARNLTHTLRNLSPAQQAALLATIAAAAGTPIDIVLLSDEYEDGPEAAAILDGVLTRIRDERYAWDIGSGCSIQITTLPKETIL